MTSRSPSAAIGCLVLFLLPFAGIGVLASGYLSPARERSIPMAEIAEVKTRIGMQAGGTAYYDLVLLRSDGRTVTAGHGICDGREAEWLAATLRQALSPGDGPALG